MECTLLGLTIAVAEVFDDADTSALDTTQHILLLEPHAHIANPLDDTSGSQNRLIDRRNG
jgi:hypothetical protein